jgi:hypothetical protein
VEPVLPLRDHFFAVQAVGLIPTEEQAHLPLAATAERVSPMVLSR